MKLLRKGEEMKNKTIYYADGATMVCLLVDDSKVVARGFSVCSKLDFFDKTLGKKYAHNRALEARGRQKDCGKIRLDLPRKTWFDRVRLSLAKDRFGDYKGQYEPILTNTEKLMFQPR